MNLTYLSHFVAVAQTLNFTQAADRIGISQPALSQSIRRLEDALGHRLFQRARLGSQLTPEGEILLSHARTILGELECAVAEMRQVSETRAKRVALGFMTNPGQHVVSAAIRAIQTAVPGAEVDLWEGEAKEQIKRLLAGDLDIGIFHPPEQNISGLQTRVIGVTHLVAGIPAGWPLAKKPVVTLRDLADHPLILSPSDRRPRFHAALHAAFASEGVTPKIAQEALYQHTRLALAGAGLGIALVSETMAVAAYKGVAIRTVAALRSLPPLELAVGWRTPASPALRRIISAVHAECKPAHASNHSITVDAAL